MKQLCRLIYGRVKSSSRDANCLEGGIFYIYWEKILLFLGLTPLFCSITPHTPGTRSDQCFLCFLRVRLSARLPTTNSYTLTLPTFCSWCGLFPMQICGECLEKNSINRETCQKCDASLILVCNNCETKNSLEADFCRSCGLQLRLFCSECREKNLSDREACQKCGVALIQLCSHCNQKNSLEAELCLRCGMPLVQVCITCGAFNDMESATCWGCRELLNIDYSSEVPFIIFRQGVF
jgi:ribosomal protein L40E